MNFVTELLRRLHDDREVPLQTAASEVYTNTLYQYHGWITSAAFTVALKVCSSAFCSSYAQHGHKCKLLLNAMEVLTVVYVVLDLLCNMC